MKSAYLLLTLIILGMTKGFSQENPPLPLREIPPAPDTYTAGTVAGRMIDALGFRYYWATEGLRVEDLTYQPSADARSTRETLEHLLGLSETIVNAPQQLPNIRPAAIDWATLSFEELRKMTLENIQKASELVKAEDGNMEDYKVIFQRGENQSEFPYWNMLNGPIADAIYHVGQIVSFRRSAGNPIPAGV
ncbi:MAG: hypothetical protein AAF824_25540, partial [Bacteroidota bacterium]